MDCHSVTDRLAGWVDDQLSPGERELFDEHLARCPRCRALAEAMLAQPLPQPAPPPIAPDFWQTMDAAIDAALDAQLETELAADLTDEVDVTAAPPLLSRRFQLSMPAVFGLVAILLLSVGFGVYSHLCRVEAEQALTAAVAQQKELQIALERQERLQATPPAEQDYSVARRFAAEPPPTRGAL